MPNPSVFSLAGLKRLFLGAPLDPLAPGTRSHMALVAFLAWVGLGADGLSSANYGPEEAFLALGSHTHLALYLAVATAVTVFIIAFAYNQVIELFPSGGGGYKVATELIGPYAGLVSGCALIVDYILTIAISAASGMDALFSLLPLHWQAYKLPSEYLIVMLLMVLNLRGMKEPIALLVPLFLGFLVTHAALILYGIIAHAAALPALLPDTITETSDLTREIGWIGVAALLLRAFAMGGGTYTGIEAVSNNVNMLREPRIETGRYTMLYMALSLAFTAAGLIVLYLLWNVQPQPGQTLNAVAFSAVLQEAFGAGSGIASLGLTLTLIFAAALLFVAANTGFLGGPAVLANMAVDRWVPHQFSQLSNRLVTQNGVLMMGGAALAALWVTHGKVHLLVVLYSVNVFLTFSLCLFGLCRYWLLHWHERGAGMKLLQAGLGLLVAGGILVVTVFEKFLHGAWLTVLATGLLIVAGLLTRRHYLGVKAQLKEADTLFVDTRDATPVESPTADPKARTAAFFVGSADGMAMHTLLAALALFPKQFRNIVFITVGEIDAEQFRGEAKIEALRAETQKRMQRFITWCARHGLAAEVVQDFGTDPVELLDKLSGDVLARYPNTVFFAAKLLFHRENLLTRLLHNETALTLQRRLHLRGQACVILPMRI